MPRLNRSEELHIHAAADHETNLVIVALVANERTSRAAVAAAAVSAVVPIAPCAPSTNGDIPIEAIVAGKGDTGRCVEQHIISSPAEPCLNADHIVISILNGPDVALDAIDPILTLPIIAGMNATHNEGVIIHCQCCATAASTTAAAAGSVGAVFATVATVAMGRADMVDLVAINKKGAAI